MPKVCMQLSLVSLMTEPIEGVAKAASFLMKDPENIGFFDAILKGEDLVQSEAMQDQSNIIPNFSHPLFLSEAVTETTEILPVENFSSMKEKNILFSETSESMPTFLSHKEETIDAVDVLYNPFILLDVLNVSYNKENEEINSIKKDFSYAIPISNTEKPQYEMSQVSFFSVQEETKDLLPSLQIPYNAPVYKIQDASVVSIKQDTLSPIGFLENTGIPSVLKNVDTDFAEKLEQEGGDPLLFDPLIEDKIVSEIIQNPEEVVQDLYAINEESPFIKHVDNPMDVLEKKSEMEPRVAQDTSVSLVGKKGEFISSVTSLPIKNQNESEFTVSLETPKDNVSSMVNTEEGTEPSLLKLEERTKTSMSGVARDMAQKAKNVSLPENIVKFEQSNFSLNETIDPAFEAITPSFEIAEAANTVTPPMLDSGSPRLSFKDQIHVVSFENIQPYKKETGEVTGQIKNEIEQLIDKGHGRVVMQLYPPKLGHVEIEVDTHRNGHMHVTFMTENKETLDILRQERNVIERTLQETQAEGEKENRTLSFSFRHGQGQGGYQEKRNVEGRPELHASSSLTQDLEVNRYFDNRVSLKENSMLATTINIFA